MTENTEELKKIINPDLYEAAKIAGRVDDFTDMQLRFMFCMLVSRYRLPVPCEIESIINYIRNGLN
jgi:hypothetical protein